MARVTSLVLLLLLIQGCGEDAPLSPTNQPSATTSTASSATTLIVVSGETNEPINEAKVIVGGQNFVTDSNGRITLEGQVTLGTLIDIGAPDFLDRQTLFRSGNNYGFTQSVNQQLFSLWPTASPTGLSETFTREMLYEWAGERITLYRPDPSFKGCIVIPDANLRKDFRAMETIREAAVSMTEVTGMSYTVGESAVDEMMPIRLNVKPEAVPFTQPGNETLVAFTDNSYGAGQVYSSSEIVFREVQEARTSTTLHELGHTLGLFHSSSRMDLMYGWTVGVSEFSARERLLIKLMMSRRPGNQWPDNDRQVSNRWSSRSGAGSGHIIITCR